jgi:hypothetical protein
MSRSTQAKQGLKQIAKGISLALGITKIYRLLSPYLKSRKSDAVTGGRVIADGFKHIFGRTDRQKLDKYLDSMVAEYPEKQASIMRAILYNEYMYCRRGESCPPSVLIAEHFVAMAKAAFDQISMVGLVGILPMSGPIDQAAFLSMTIPEDQPAEVSVSSSDEAKSSLDGLPDAVPGRRMSLSLINKAISAGSSRLSVSYSSTAVDDLVRTTGMSQDAATDAMAKILGQEIGFELDARLLSQVSRLASPLKATAAPRIDIQINQAANQIARDTRRGPGNWVVLSNEAYNALRAIASSSTFVPFPNAVTTGVLTHVGTMNGSIKVYVVQEGIIQGVLVGYKGSEVDCGIKYMPYVPVMTSGIVMNPVTFEPIVGMLTREAIAHNDNAENYYVKFDIE